MAQSEWTPEKWREYRNGVQEAYRLHRLDKLYEIAYSLTYEVERLQAEVRRLTESAGSVESGALPEPQGKP